MVNRILELLNEIGPSTGSELSDASGMDGLELWRTCMGSPRLETRHIGRRYLRLDRRIEGFGRLSPSILREFLTYTVIAPHGEGPAADLRAGDISRRIDTVTKEKSELAYDVISALVNRSDNPDIILEQACFILAGDIVYNMAHEVPRPERSTGKLVQGSDIDLVVVVDDSFPGDHLKRLDERIFKEKYRLLVTPHVREELDYVVKDLERVREQLQFDTFRRMVACKILQEGTLLFGSEALFTQIKKMLHESGVAHHLREMETAAAEFRERAWKILLEEDMDTIRRDHLDLFYPTEESEEFE